jgi:hypothetical protein
MTKQQLTDEPLHNPLNFDNLMLEDLLDSGFGTMDIRECIRTRQNRAGMTEYSITKEEFLQIAMRSD